MVRDQGAPGAGDVQLIALLFTLVVMFALKGDVILQIPLDLADGHAAGLFFFVLFFV